MSLLRKKRQQRWRRAKRVRTSLKRNSTLPRVSVFRSLQQLYAQVIDDQAGTTLVSCSTLELKKIKGDKKDRAKAVGLELAQRAQKQGIKVACFDRGAYRYHGRVKAVAEGLREGGLSI